MARTDDVVEYYVMLVHRDRMGERTKRNDKCIAAYSTREAAQGHINGTLDPALRVNMYVRFSKAAVRQWEKDQYSLSA